MKKIIIIFLSICMSNIALSKEHYVYKASILKVLKANLIIDVEEAVNNNEPVLFVKSHSTIRFMGNEIVNLDYLAFNDVTTFEPKINIECEHSDKRPEKNCRSVKFLPDGQFLYKESHNSNTQLEDLVVTDPDVVLEKVQTQQPTYNSNEDKIFDIASIVLLVKYLNINKDNRERDLFIAVNSQLTKVKVSYVQDIDENKIWIKLTPLWPGPENYETEFPHKIVYDKRLKTVTEVHKKLPYVGSVVIRLDQKESSF